MEIMPIFFKEIFFFDFLEELASVLLRAVVPIREGKTAKRDFSFLK